MFKHSTLTLYNFYSILLGYLLVDLKKKNLSSKSQVCLEILGLRNSIIFEKQEQAKDELPLEARLY